MTTNEIWRDVKDYEGRYRVSNKGRIKSVARVVRNYAIPEKILGERLNTYGYPQVALHRDNNRWDVTVHRLVTDAFLGPSNEGRPVINHKNGIKNDNRVENLEVVNQKENILHAWRTGLAKGRLSQSDVIIIRELYADGVRQQKIADIYGIDQPSVSTIVNRRRYAFVT